MKQQQITWCSPWGCKELPVTERLSTTKHSTAQNITWGFPGGSDDIEPACNAGDPSSIPGSGRCFRERKGYPLQHSCLEIPNGQRSLMGFSPWGCKESDTTEQLRTRKVTCWDLDSVNYYFLIIYSQ